MRARGAGSTAVTDLELAGVGFVAGFPVEEDLVRGGPRGGRVAARLVADQCRRHQTYVPSIWTPAATAVVSVAANAPVNAHAMPVENRFPVTPRDWQMKEVAATGIV
jgi:hypothetical protein